MALFKLEFKNYGTDFALREEGLAEIPKTVPAFKAIDFDAIGLQSEIGKETAGVVIQDVVFEESNVTINIVNDSKTVRSGILVTITSKDGETAEMKMKPISVSGKSVLPKTVELSKPYDKIKIFVLRDILSLQIYSKIIEQ